MILFMWQDALIGTGVALFVDVCSERMYTSAGPPLGSQASDQPSVGRTRCNYYSSSGALRGMVPYAVWQKAV